MIHHVAPDMLPVLIYDGDCGFCTRCVRLAERLPTQVHVLPWQQADLAALGTTQARAQREVILVTASGQVYGGAAAVAELLRTCQGLWRIPGSLMTLPVVRTLAARTYRWVAAHRYQLPGSTPACRLPEHLQPGSGLS